MSDPTRPTAPDAAAPDELVDHDHDLAAVVRAASIDAGSPGALYRCGPEAVAACVRTLAADNERLREGFGRAVDAHEDDVLAVWRALGGTHEPPDDTATIIDAIARLTADLARLRAPSADVAAIGARAASLATLRTELRAYLDDHTRSVFDIPVALIQRRDEAERKSAADVPTLLALLAAEREGRAAEVAGARAAVAKERAALDAYDDAVVGSIDECDAALAAFHAARAAVDAALAVKGAPDV